MRGWAIDFDITTTRCKKYLQMLRSVEPNTHTHTYTHTHTHTHTLTIYTHDPLRDPEDLRRNNALEAGEDEAVAAPRRKRKKRNTRGRVSAEGLFGNAFLLPWNNPKSLPSALPVGEPSEKKVIAQKSSRLLGPRCLAENNSLSLSQL